MYFFASEGVQQTFDTYLTEKWLVKKISGMYLDDREGAKFFHGTYSED